jgi:hypothetical protein
MPDNPSVTVEHGGLTVTTNTASEADVRAALEQDAPAAPDSPTAGLIASFETPAQERARDEKGRFARTEPAAPPAELPDAAAEAAPDPTEAAAHPPQRRRDDSLPRHNPIARMSQALQQKAEAERRAAALEAELLRYRQAVPAAPPAPAPAPVPAAANGQGEPQFEAFADQPDPYTAYMDAKTDWKLERRLEQRIAQLQQEHAERLREQMFNARLAEGRKAFPDFDQVLTQADTLGLQVSAVMREAIADSPKAADLVHFLATHPEECTQLALESETTPTAAAQVMRRYLESQLAPRAVPSHGNGAAAKAVASQAKPPISPVGSSPVVSDDPPGESASAAEHARYWNRRLKVPGT